MPESSPSKIYFPDEVAVALCVYGSDLDPIEVTKLLGVDPTHAHRRGERKTLRSPPWDKGAWIRELRCFEPIDPDGMFEELLLDVSSEPAVWRSLASRFQLRVDFAVHTDVGCTFVLSPNTVQRIAALGAEFQIYIQAYGDNDA
ncbi:DUF4279 domain-containing protein [Piscinibacter terrae]|uniref:DUF4279 domain-containing protein n=1 Tax=Piscinibacter terrae TaxID=2496871 RepID=A0A3N7JI95_9BURK|nr:DUF4279 domain-containing protein [Albitalea terrae]